jgi:hypothetical protein
MGAFLIPGYLRWDGLKFVTDPNVEIIGPPGPPGPGGPPGQPTLTNQANILYVSQTGNDISGDGTIFKPFATYAQAATTAVGNGAASGNFYAVQFAPGQYAENMALVPFVVINGFDRLKVGDISFSDGSTIFTGTIGLDPSFASFGNPISGISTVTISGNVDFNFLGIVANGTICLNDVFVKNFFQSEGTGSNNIYATSSAFISDSGTITVQGIRFITINCSIQVQANFSSPTSSTVWSSYGGSVNSTIVSDGSTENVTTITMIGTGVGAGVQLNGANALYTSDLIGVGTSITLTGGAPAPIITGSGSATLGQVPTANGTGQITWTTPGGMNFQETGVPLVGNPYDHLNVIGNGGNISDVGGVATLDLTPSGLPPKGLTCSLRANEGTNVVGGTGTQTTIASGSNGAILPQAVISVVSTAGFDPSGGTIYILTYTGGGGNQDGLSVVLYSGISGNTFTGCTGGAGTMHTEDLVTDGVVRQWLNVARVGEYFSTSGYGMPNPSGINGNPTIDFTFPTAHETDFTPAQTDRAGDAFVSPNGFSFATAFKYDDGSGIALVNTTIASGSNNQPLPQSSISVVSTSGFNAPGIFTVTIGSTQQVISYTGTSGGNTFTGCTGGTGTLLTNQEVDQVYCYYVQNIFGYGTESNAMPALGVNSDPVNPNTHFRFICYFANSGQVPYNTYFVVSPPLTQSDPHYCVVTYSGLNQFATDGYFHMYVDGGSAIISGPCANVFQTVLAGSSPPHVGAGGQDAEQILGGRLLEIDVWNRALSPAEVTAAEAWLVQQGGF